jgi:hypothetical protein
MTQPLSVAAALLKGCYFCKRPLAPEAALLVAATWELIGAPQSRSCGHPGVCCQGCFDKHSMPVDDQAGADRVVENASPVRFALYDIDAAQLATTRVFDSKSEAEEVANTLNDVIVVPMPVEPRSESFAEEDESEPCECEAPDQPFYCGVPGILAHVENGRVVPDTRVERCDACERFASDDAAREKLRELGMLVPETPPPRPEVGLDPKSKYQGRTRFDREQLVFIVETILAGALDSVECDLPSEMALVERKDGSMLSDYERGGVEAAVFSLGLLYTRITVDHPGVVDALRLAGRFDKACERLVEAARGDGATRFKEYEERLRAASGGPLQLGDVYGTLWPDTRKHAERFVDEGFTAYLKAAEPRNTASSKLTPAQARFFEAEIRNERSGGVGPATLDSAVESLMLAPEDVIVSWCADESVTEATAQGFVSSIIELRDRFGGHVELRALISD